MIKEMKVTPVVLEGRRVRLEPLESAHLSQLADAALDPAEERVIGSTRYGNIDHQRRCLDIGWTWVEKEWERVAGATEAKYLLLKHAFEELRCIRVGLRSSTVTDWMNMLTRDAILSTRTFDEDGSEDQVSVANSRIRHDVHFSIVESAWPRVKERIERMLRSREVLT